MEKEILLASPHMGGKELNYIEEAFRTNWVAPAGENINKFEEEIAEYVGVKGAVALSSGTAAIHLALKCIGIKSGDKVFCSSLTFVASCNPILYEGAIPVFIDSEPESLNMSPKALKKAFNDVIENNEELPKAVIVVNLYGQSADLDNIREICDIYNVPIIEDAAESLGSTYGDKKSGTIGEYGIYSFNGNKIITTSGGGMLVSNNLEMLKKAKFWSTQAKEEAPYYQHTEIGFNYRMSNISAGIGRGQLLILERRIEQKNHIYQRYKDELKDLNDFQVKEIQQWGKSNCWLTIGVLDKICKITSLELIRRMKKENIELRPIWKPMNLQPLYENYKFYNHNDTGVSVSEEIFATGVCMPSDTNMNEEDIDRVINTIRRILNNE